jgi:hypothetical protein
MRLIAGTADPLLRDKFFREANPTSEVLLRIAREHERSKNTNKAIDGAEASANVVETDGPAAANVSAQAAPTAPASGAQRRPVDEFFKATMASLRAKGICTTCGTKTCSGSCDKKTLKCTFCKKPGHGVGACVKRHRAQASGGSSSNTQRANSLQPASEPSDPNPPPSDGGAAGAVSTVRINAAHVADCNPTPRAPVYLEDVQTQRAITLNCLPDTGATRSVISLDIAQRFGFAVRPATYTLRAANGAQMPCSGVVAARLIYGGREIFTDVIVSADLVGELLLGWEELRLLRVIPEHFPRPMEVSVVSANPPTPPTDFLSTLLSSFADVFHELPLKPMKGAPMRIHLNDGSSPSKCLTARQTPIHLAAAAQETLAKALASGVIVPTTVPTDWISPAFFVEKPNGRGARMVTDYTALNRHVRRPVHPFPSPLQLLQKLGSTSRCFATFDAVSGYFQIPLDYKSSLLTTFILPEGRFRYTRAPMGLNASSDEWCARSDAALEGLQGVHKIVDDILVAAESWPQLRERVTAVLRRCREHGITLAGDKAQVGSEVKFAGFLVGSNGVRPDPAKVAAIRDFPPPASLPELRSFLGLAVQLAHFVPDLAHMTAPLRGLLSKNVVYQWLPEHQAAFDKVRELLTSPMATAFYQPGAPVRLLTDASRLKGLGYALQQFQDGQWRLIRCGSRFLTPTEARWATVELETLAIYYGITACEHYLRAAPTFEVVTDHRPLPHAFKKGLADVENVRIARIREKLTPYTFEVRWNPGKMHLAADALSRNPVFDAPDRDCIDTVPISLAVITEDPLLADFAAACAGDEDHQRLLRAVQADDVEAAPTTFRGVWARLGTDSRGLVLLDGHRLVVPHAAQPNILAKLHRGHCGLVKTTKLARQLYYWPAMASDIKNLVARCAACQELRPSQPGDALRPIPAPSEPMEAVATDLCELDGKDYIVLVDRFSGYVWVARIPNIRGDTVIAKLNDWFLEFGYPRIIASDHGRQFLDRFDEWCAARGIAHKPFMSSPHHHQANGLAEAGVKQVKALLKKSDSWAAFLDGLFHYRSTPRAVGELSPAELFFGRRLRTSLPAWSPPPTPPAESPPADGDADSPDRLPSLGVGARVRLQDPISKRWDATGTVVAIRDTMRSYEVARDGGGQPLLRNRRFLKPLPVSPITRPPRLLRQLLPLLRPTTTCLKMAPTDPFLLGNAMTYAARGWSAATPKRRAPQFPEVPSPEANVGETHSSSGVHFFEGTELIHITSAGVSVGTLILVGVIAAILYRCCGCKPRCLRRRLEPALPAARYDARSYPCFSWSHQRDPLPVSAASFPAPALPPPVLDQPSAPPPASHPSLDPLRPHLYPWPYPGPGLPWSPATAVAYRPTPALTYAGPPERQRGSLDP